MALTRRQFLTLAGGSVAGAVVFQACGIPEQELFVQSPTGMPEDLVTGIDNWFATICGQCSSSEGIVVRVMEGRAKKIEGNLDYPTNMGKHSARCESGLQALYHPDRIRGPMVRDGERGSGEFQEISWDDAISRMVVQLQSLKDSGQESRMVMVTNPVGAHLGTVVDRFVNRFGGRHIAYEPLEQTTLRRAVKQVFDQDLLPDFDIENAAYVLSFGADFLNTWMSPVRYARGYGNFRQGDRERGILVHADSRFSMTAANADKWLPVKPGMEGFLALSIAQVLIEEGLADEGAAQALTGNGALDLSAYRPETIASQVGITAEAISPQTIREVAEAFGSHSPALAIGGGSAAATTNGLFNLSAIYSLNYLVGSVGKKGGIIFNPESPLDDVPAAPSTGSFADMQRLTGEMAQGAIQVLMVRGANPMYGLPGSVGFRNASFSVPFIFSFSEIMDDTARMADLILPEHNYLETWGSDVSTPGPGYQTIGFQQPVVRPFFEARGEHLGTKGFGDVLLTTAQGLGLDLGLPGSNFKDFLQDSADKLFALNRGSVRASSSGAFWNGLLQRGGWWDTSERSKYRPVDPPRLAAPQQPEYDSNAEFHLVPFMTTGLDDGKLAHLPWMQATPDPITTATWRTWIEINAREAEQRDIQEGDVIKVTSVSGSIEALAFPNPGTPTGVVSIPVGQGHEGSGRYASGRGSNVYSILWPKSDQNTGALAWASTRVNIEKTGRWVRVPKYENTVNEFPRDEEQLVVKITPHDT